MKYSSKKYLQLLFEAAVESCLPRICMPSSLDKIDASKGLCVLGAGKASAEMAEVMFEHFGEKCFGAVVASYGNGHKKNTGKIEVLEASHPVPDSGSLQAAKKILKLASDNKKDIPIIFLISGGGSSLMSLPVDGVSFSDKVELNKFLLKSGASIDEINVIRKQLSKIKGGRLAAVSDSQMTTLIISDVVGDAPELIASGPTVKDTGSSQQALQILNKYHWPVTPEIENFLKSNRPAPVIKGNNELRIIANGKKAIDAAVKLAQSQDWNTQVIDYQQEGEATEVAKQHAKLALEAKANGEPVILFCGGELTVSLGDAKGCGGPNQEYLLALAIELKGEAGISALSCDTDGIDGSEEVAGAFIDQNTLAKAAELGLSADEYLIKHNSFDFFNALGDLVVTGQTNTNVNDFRAIMISS